MRHLAIFIVAGIALVVASPLEVERLRKSIFLNGKGFVISLLLYISCYHRP